MPAPTPYFRKAPASPFRPRGSGFTLAEVIVALALFALLVAVVGQNIGGNMRALAAMNDNTDEVGTSRVLRLIREQIEQVPSREQMEEGGEIEIPQLPPPGRDKAGGEEGSQPVKVRWSAEVNPTSTLDLVTVTVELQPQSTNISLPAQFLISLYRPGWTTPDDRDRILEAKRQLYKDQLDLLKEDKR